MAASPAADIIKAVGGPSNITSLSHCATRLRFQLADMSGVDPKTIDKIPGVMGVVPQGTNGMQVVIGGAVQGVYNDIINLPEMKGAAGAPKKLTDAELKEQAKAGGVRGKFGWIDGFFEFLGDSFRPILPALLGASLFITMMSLLATTHVIGNWADPKVNLGTSWNFVNLLWQAVFYFLPLMVAYNASKRVGADPWVGFAIMGLLLLPGFSGLMGTATPTKLFGAEVSVQHIFGIPLYMRDYGSQVFPPLLMAGLLGPLYKGLKKIIPANLQLIFVPFIAFLIMMPLTAFIIGPIGVVAGAGLSHILSAINNFSPFIFSIVIPLAYPFMVPLGLHWPINAIMLLNIQQLGYDFIQGPMGAWNFACFGATAAVLLTAMRQKDNEMKQTASGALAAGLLGGISEPSLYGIHLRFKRIYPSMLVGCFAGGLVMGIGGGVKAHGFAFTSLLTIPNFYSMVLYTLGIAVAFFTAMGLVLFRGYQTPEQKAERLGELAADGVGSVSPAAFAGGAAAGTATAVAAAPAATAAAAPRAQKPAMVAGTQTVVNSPLAGRVMPLAEIPDPVFSQGIVGQGVGVLPSGDTVYAPAPGKILVAQATGHAFGISLDSGVELLIHVGIDTVQLNGKGFDVKVKAGDVVTAGTPLVTFDRGIIEAAGYSLVTPVLVTNSKKFGSIAQVAQGDVAVGSPLIQVNAKDA